MPMRFHDVPNDANLWIMMPIRRFHLRVRCHGPAGTRLHDYACAVRDPGEARDPCDCCGSYRPNEKSSVCGCALLMLAWPGFNRSFSRVAFRSTAFLFETS